ncbi:hypothetical protein cypCar_00047905, partial [Cyprinus carpio]
MQMSKAPLLIDVRSGHASADDLIGRQRPILRRPSPSASQSEERVPAERCLRMTSVPERKMAAFGRGLFCGCDACDYCCFEEMLQFVSNQVDFPDLFEDQMGGGAVAPARPLQQTAPSTILTPPHTPIQTSSQTQTRTPPLLQPRPQPITQTTPLQVQTQTFPMQTLAVQTQAQPQTVMITPTGTQTHRFIHNQVICQQNPGAGFQGETHTHSHTHTLTHTFTLYTHTLSHAAVSFSVLQPQMQSIMTSPQVQPMTIQHQRLLTPSGQTFQTLSTTPVHTVSQQVLLHQPQILKTDSLVLTTLKPDGTQVLSTVHNPPGITTLTAPLQTTSLQVPNMVLFMFGWRGYLHRILDRADQHFPDLLLTVPHGDGRRKTSCQLKSVPQAPPHLGGGPGCIKSWRLLRNSPSTYIKYLQQRERTKSSGRRSLTAQDGHHKSRFDGCAVFVCVSEAVCLSDEVDLKPEVAFISPPPSDSGCSSPPQLSPFCIDSEPGSPLLEHEPVKSEPDSPSSVGVMDRSRLLLCTLTFLCLSLNPLPSLLGSEESAGLTAAHGPTRSLFSLPAQSFGAWLWCVLPWLLVWVLSGVGVVWGCV